MTIVSWEFESPSLHFSIFIFLCGNSSVGRAQPCQGWGREFESRFPLLEIHREMGFHFFVYTILSMNIVIGVSFIVV